MTSTTYEMPALPLGSAEITILRWLKHPGDACQAGEPLLIALNDRIEVALPTPVDGILTTHAAAGSNVVPSATIATFTPDLVAESTPPATPQAAPRATPVARRMADTLGIALNELIGTGAAGRIVKADVLRAAAPPASASAPADATPVPMPTGRSIPAIAIPTRLAAADDTFVLTSISVDLSAAEAHRTSIAPLFARRGLHVDLAAYIAQAAISALVRYPFLNAWWDAECIIMPQRIQLAYQFGERTGLLADAQDYNLQGFARAFSAQHASSIPEHWRTTFSITTTKGWALFSQPLPVAPQTSLLTCSAPGKQPTVVSAGKGERLSIQLNALLTLAYDARIAEHAYADAFLHDIAGQLKRLH